MTSQQFPHPSSRQDGFKSEGETQIARLLDRYGIPYRYEPPVAVEDRGKVRLWYPDFRLSGHGLLIEYAGVQDDPAYETVLRKKQAVYEANGLTALVWRPDLFRGDWPTRALDRIEEALTRRVDTFRAARQAGQGRLQYPCGRVP